MSDIVKRLRAPAYWMSGTSEGHEGDNSAPREAASTIEALQARVRELEGERDKAYNDGLEAAAVWHESQTRFGLSQYAFSAKEIRGLKRENFHHNSAENIRALGASS